MRIKFYCIYHNTLCQYPIYAFNRMGQEGKYTLRQSCCKPTLEELKELLLLIMRQNMSNYLHNNNQTLENSIDANVVNLVENMHTGEGEKISTCQFRVFRHIF